PSENAQFLLFLVAVIKAVDEYQDLLRISVASAGNDFRLGANEAPPAIISMFIGSELQEVLDSIETGKPIKSKGKSFVKIGADVLPDLPKDTTDRNRTSPFAFTGNKFEFRAVGSSESISCANIMLNTAVAEELKKFADILEKSKDFDNDLHKLIKDTIIAHKRIIFNGNGYDDAWIKEAEKRGLLNLKSTPEALPYYLDKKNIDLFTSHSIYTINEIKARYEIAQEHYAKVVNIEALTALDMVNKYYLPSISKFSNFLIGSIANKKSIGLNAEYETNTASILADASNKIYEIKRELENSLVEKDKITDCAKLSTYLKDNVLTKMEALRTVIDEIELIVDKDYWPFVSYGDLLYSVK
ncbi:MAG: hypothetical protein IKR19_02375, partial [Acholeplasmatales bacterium]|nr:hypothetical protein [Acholeplasmatales bacterium]